MKGCYSPLIGRFGNACFQYAYARAYAEQNGLELHTPRWIGEKVFQIEPTPENRDDDVILGGYCQNQKSVDLYTRKQVRQWFKFRPEIEEKLKGFATENIPVIAHFRHGDFAGYGYPVISKASYHKAISHFGLEFCGQTWIVFVSEEYPLKSDYFDRIGAPFLPDFYRLMKAPVLLRANSSFSWFAATLGEGRVFSPMIRGLVGGRENDCEFTEGNHNQLSETVDCTDMHLFKDADLLDHNLNADSLVYEIGGYLGDFTANITRKFCCKVKVFEPCQEFYEKLQARFGQNKLVELHKAGVGKEDRQMEITWKGSMTGELADGEQKQKSWMYDIADLVTRENRQIQLMQINCEGGEYDILERLIEQNLTGCIRDIQVQFHPLKPEHAARYAAIREALDKTHRITFDEPFVWQGWELR